MAEDLPATTTNSAGQSDDDVHGVAVRQFDSIIVAVQEERQLALQDRRFCSIAGAMWEDQWGDLFDNSIKVEVNKTAQGVEKILEHYRSNRVTVEFRAVGDASSAQTASTLNGMFRADVYNSKGQQAFDNGFEEGVMGGIGAWRLINRREDPYDPDNLAQRIFFEAIVDADQSVFWDPNSKLYDKSDAQYCFVLTAMARAAYVAEYGEEGADWSPGIWKAHYDWYTPDVIYVAEYYRVEHVSDRIIVLRHKVTGEQRREYASRTPAEQIADLEIQGWQVLRRTQARRRIVRKWTMSGQKMLSKGKTIAGSLIPVVPFYGKRWFIDNMERSRGHVRLAKDPNRIYNSQVAKLVETSALAPLERPIVTTTQIAGHEQSWADANINRAAYALINPTMDANGNELPSGPVGKIEPPTLAPVTAALIQLVGSDLAEITNSQDGADTATANISADAMDIAATRTDAKAGIYMDNMRQSMQRCGEIYASMAPDVYVEEGREVETMDADGGEGTAILAEPFTDPNGRFQIRNDLAAGKYRVISDVTEATATRRDKTVKTLVNAAGVIASVDPEAAAAMLNTALLNMDGEGMTDLQDWIRSRLVTQGIVKPTPEEQAQMEQAAQQQQPDPQAQALAAVADKEGAAADKYRADTILSEAKTEQTIAETEKIRVETEDKRQEHRVGLVERVTGMFKPKPKAGQPAKPAP